MSIRATNWAYALFKTADIPPQERAVLLCLCWHHVDKTGGCFPSAETLAVLTGYRRRRVFDAIKSLEDWGLIQREKRRVEGHQGSNQFRLFGRFNRAAFDATSVHKKALCESADGSTLPECPPVTHERGDISYRAKRASQGGETQRALRLIVGGRA